jgi:hypothetical protein
MGDVILTDEIRDKLLGVAPFSIDSTYDYISKYHKSLKDLPESFIPVFTISPFNKEEKERVSKILKPGGKELENAELRNILKPKIKGFKNLFDLGTKEEIKFVMENGVITQSIYDRITDNICSDLLTQVIRISGLLDVDRLALRY